MLEEIIHTGPDILNRPLPSLTTRRDYVSPLHPIRFNGPIARWDPSNLIRECTSAANMATGPLYIRVQDPTGAPSWFDMENFLCSSEKSICGRFAENALSPVTTVAFQNNIKARFGDFWVCEEVQRGTTVPRFVAVNCSASTVAELRSLREIPLMRFVGEAKTAWNHPLRAWYTMYCNNAPDELRCALGQIAEYMYDYKTKYGFLTTYDHTIFLKQEIGERSEPCLYLTPPIPYNAYSKSPQDGIISVRQYLYYLLKVTMSYDYTFDNPLPRTKWAVSAEAESENSLTITPQPPLPSELTMKKAAKAKVPLQRVSDDDPMKLYKWGNGYRALLRIDPQHICGAPNGRGESELSMIKAATAKVPIQRVSDVNPIKFYKRGNGYRALLSIDPQQIRDAPNDRGQYVRVCGQDTPVVIITDHDSGDGSEVKRASKDPGQYVRICGQETPVKIMAEHDSSGEKRVSDHKGDLNLTSTENPRMSEDDCTKTLTTALPTLAELPPANQQPSPDVQHPTLPRNQPLLSRLLSLNIVEVSQRLKEIWSLRVGRLRDKRLIPRLSLGVHRQQAHRPNAATKGWEGSVKEEQENGESQESAEPIANGKTSRGALFVS